MADVTSKFTVLIGGKAQEIEVDDTLYLEAQAADCTIEQLMNQKYKTGNEGRETSATRVEDMTVYEQIRHQSGFRAQGDSAFAQSPSSVGQLFAMDGAIVRGDYGTLSNAQRRLFAPAFLLDMVRANLIDNLDDYMSAYDSMIGNTRYVSGSTVERVEMTEVSRLDENFMDYKRSAQLAEPDVMITWKTSERSWKIPTFTVGLEISYEAALAGTVDRLATTLAQNFREFQIAAMFRDLSAIINGDTDFGLSAITFKDASDYDTTAGITWGTSDTKLSERAWIKFLMENSRKWTKNIILTDDDGYLDFQDRLNRPIITTDTSSQPGRTILPTARFRNVPAPEMYALPVEVLGGAGRWVGMDSTQSLQRFVNIDADYSAMRDMVIRKGLQMRYDIGSLVVPDRLGTMTGLTLGA